MRPASDLQRRCEVGVVLAAIASKLQLADHERWVGDTETETVAIACVRVAGTGP
jgi:hypothetical protein